MEEFKIRELNKDDIEKILPLRIALQVFDYGRINVKINEKRLEEHTREYLKTHLGKSIIMFGGFVGENLVSICGYNIFEYLPIHSNPSGREANICSVYTKEEYRGKGYMTKLFEVCVNHAKNNGLNRLKLSSGNPIAVNIYKKFGFSKHEDTYKCFN